MSNFRNFVQKDTKDKLMKIIIDAFEKLDQKEKKRWNKNIESINADDIIFNVDVAKSLFPHMNPYNRPVQTKISRLIYELVDDRKIKIVSQNIINSLTGEKSISISPR